jgi:G3E family GTPase
MRLLLFAGFLGSGKTTLILALARQAAFRDARVAVIVNEVGEVGIDGEVLRMGDLQVKEITAGCICCQIGVDLIRTLRELEESYRPDLVIIEASGIATPAGVLEALQRYPAKTVASIETVTVVDPERFEALYEVLTPLIESQIVGADRLVVTKVDEASAEEVDLAVRTMEALAPYVPVYLVDATREESLTPFLTSLDQVTNAVGAGRAEVPRPGAAPSEVPRGVRQSGAEASEAAS